MITRLWSVDTQPRLRPAPAAELRGLTGCGGVGEKGPHTSYQARLTQPNPRLQALPTLKLGGDNEP